MRQQQSSVDISSYHVESKVVMTATKTYGLMIADIGSDWYFQGDSDDGWNANAQDGKDTIIDELVGDFGNLHGSDFEAIDSGKAYASARSASASPRRARAHARLYAARGCVRSASTARANRRADAAYSPFA